MTQEALKLALEFIENSECGTADLEARIKEALAQTQEPVGHRDGYWCADLTCKKCYSADFRFKHKNSVDKESLTTPPQRTWVGLTDEEIDYYMVHRFGVATKKNLVELIRLCETKLKELNT